MIAHSAPVGGITIGAKYDRPVPLPRRRRSTRAGNPVIANIRVILSLITPNLRRRWTLVAVLGAAVGILEALSALLVVGLFAAMSPSSGGLPIPLIGRLDDFLNGGGAHDARLTTLCLIVAAVFLLRAVLVVGQLHLQYDTAGRSGLDLSERLLRLYLRLPLADHLRDNSARFVRTVQESTQVVAVQAFIPIIAIASESALIVAMVVVLLLAAPVPTVLAGALLTFSATAVLRVVQPRIAHHGRVGQAEIQTSLQALNEAFGGIRDVKVNGSETFFLKMFMTHRRRYIHSSYRPYTLAALPRVSVETTMIIALVVLLGISQRGSSATEEALPLLALFGYAMLRLLPSANRIINASTNLRFGLAAVHIIRDDLDALDKIAELPPSEGHPLPFERVIDVVDVSYRYPGADRRALHQVSLRIPRGSSLGIVGRTGSGKSTLVDVLLGLLPPELGVVSVDGTDIRDDLPGWHAGAGLVPQSIFLLDTSLRRNIAFASDDDDVEEERLRDAVRLAQLDDLVEALPDGLDTDVGERGARLSGGQRQRVVIARALYRRPSFIVFDEGTSALDTATESSLLAALDALVGSHTVVMVAHRLSTVRSCDQVIVLADGRIEATGTYDELLASSAVFQRLSSS